MPWFRICGDAASFGRLQQEAVALAHHRMPHDLGQRRHRADLEAVAGRADAAQFVDAAQIDDVRRPLDAILQPVEAVEPAGHHPGVAPVPAEQLQRVADRRGLEQLERRHHVANYRHDALLTPPV